MASKSRLTLAVLATVLAAAINGFKIDLDSLPEPASAETETGARAGSGTGHYTDGVSLRAVAQSNNGFMAKLYDIISKTEPGNFIFSPMAVSTQVGMLKQGAQGATSAELGKTTVHTFSDTTILNGFLGLTRLYQVTPATKSTTNKILLTSDFPLNDAYRTVIESYFNGEFKKVTEMTRENVEDVFDNMLANKYKGLLSVASIDQKLTFKTAGAFNSVWETPFDKSRTAMLPFHKADGGVVVVEMMKAFGEFEVADFPSLDAKAISIPFADNQLNLIVLKPNKRSSFPQLEHRMKGFTFNLLSNKLLKTRLTPVSVTIPKMVFKSAHDLQEPLEMMGIKSIFSPKTANFSGLHHLDGVTNKGAVPLHVTDFIQSAQLYINEDGAFGVDPALQPPVNVTSPNVDYSPFIDPDFVTEFNANQPFIGYIHDWITDTVLYTFRKVE